LVTRPERLAQLCTASLTSHQTNFTPNFTRSYTRIVKLTLLGSIVSNLLLVMGSAFIAGGVLHPMQHFNKKGINMNCGLLILTGGLLGARAAGAGWLGVLERGFVGMSFLCVLCLCLFSIGSVTRIPI
jgi:hypothetical protein